MPRKRIQDQMTKFYDWMTACGFSESTAKVYSTSCRGLQRKFGDDFLASPEMVEHVSTLKAEHPKLHATCVSANNCYKRFLESNGTVVTVNGGKRKRAKSIKSSDDENGKFPAAVELAIRVIEAYNRKAVDKVVIS